MRARELDLHKERLSRPAGREDDGVVVLKGEAIEEHGCLGRRLDAVEQARATGQIAADEGKGRAKGRRRERARRAERIGAKRQRRHETVAHLEMQPSRLQTPAAEQRLQALGVRCDLAAGLAPRRECEGHVEEPLGAVGEVIAQRRGGFERGTPVGVDAGAALLAHPQRRRELGDAALEETHRHQSARGRDVQRDVEVGVSGREAGEPARRERRRIAHDDARAGETAGHLHET